MSDPTSYLWLSVAVFAGAFVSSLAGFAFSAVAGAVLLHVLQPLEAIPLMMACSVGVQSASLWALRRNLALRGSLLLIVGGLLGIPIALYLLQHTNTQIFRMGFGIFVALYAGYMLFRPTLAYLRHMQSLHRNVLVGFGGGLVGGLTAMPGALPAIWCDLHGLSKNEQRGLVQPFIAVMQIFALVLMLSHHNLSSRVWIEFAVSIPALIAGTTLGILMFHHANELTFRRIILVVLFISGVGLVL